MSPSTSPTRAAMTFHCLRDTGLTHMAGRNDNPIRVQWAAGHTSFKMTETYISRGRAEQHRIGTPLPPLPASILSPKGKGSESDNKGSCQRILSQIRAVMATPTGIEF